jgi:hypothetical protein
LADARLLREAAVKAGSAVVRRFHRLRSGGRAGDAGVTTGVLTLNADQNYHRGEELIQRTLPIPL